MCVSMRLCMCMARVCIEHKHERLLSAAARAWGWVWCTGAECARFSGSIWKVSSLSSAREAARRRRGDGGEVAREEVRAEAERASRRRWCFGEGFGEGFDQLDPLEPRRARRGDGGSETAEARARSREPRRLRRGDGEREMAVAGRPRRRRAGRAPTDRARPSRSKGTCAAVASEAACAAKAWTCVYYISLHCTVIDLCIVLDGSDASAKAAIHTSGSARPRTGRKTAVRRCRGVSVNGDVDSLAVLRGSEQTVPMSAEAAGGDDGMLRPQTHVSRPWMHPTGKRYPDPQTHVSRLVSPYA